MAKIFNELKPGDTLYCLSIYTIYSGVRKGNCTLAYKKLNKHFSLEEYPAISEIGEYKVQKLEETEDKYFGIPSNDKQNVVVYYYNGVHQTYQIFNKTTNTDVKNNLSNSYHIYSTSKEEIISKGREIIHALMAVNRNVMIEWDKCYNAMLTKLNNNL